MRLYTTQLQAGLGMVEETRKLLELWETGMTTNKLFQKSLDSGNFPNISARRLRNIITECFVPRFLISKDFPALLLKQLMDIISLAEFHQLLFLFTCRANPILADFVQQVYWERYASGHEFLSNEDAKDFVTRAVQQGKTVKPWSENTIRRVSGYLTGCCADFGLLEHSRSTTRRIISFRIQPSVTVILAYDLHFSGVGDNALQTHQDWQLFGIDVLEVRDELKQLSLKKHLIFQSAGDLIHIGWSYRSWEEVLNVITQG